MPTVCQEVCKSIFLLLWKIQVLMLGWDRKGWRGLGGLTHNLISTFCATLGLSVDEVELSTMWGEHRNCPEEPEASGLCLGFAAAWRHRGLSLSRKGHPMSPPQSVSDLHILCLLIVPGKLKFLVSSMCSWQRLGSRTTYNQVSELMRKMKIGRVTQSLVTHKNVYAYDSYRWLWWEPSRWVSPGRRKNRWGDMSSVAGLGEQAADTDACHTGET